MTINCIAFSEHSLNKLVDLLRNAFEDMCKKDSRHMPLVWIEDAHSCRDMDVLKSLSSKFLGANFKVLHTISEFNGMKPLEKCKIILFILTSFIVLSIAVSGHKSRLQHVNFPRMTRAEVRAMLTQDVGVVERPVMDGSFHFKESVVKASMKPSPETENIIDKFGSHLGAYNSYVIFGEEGVTFF